MRRARVRRTDGALETSVCAEIKVLGGHEFYDFEAKYLEVDDVTELDVPADLPDEVSERVRALAAVAFARWTARASRAWTSSSRPTAPVTVNEVNTIPGFTPVSMFPLHVGRRGVPTTRRWSTA